MQKKTAKITFNVDRAVKIFINCEAVTNKLKQSGFEWKVLGQVSR